MPHHGKNIERDAELSKRIYARNIPNKPVQMYFSQRSVDTRFTRFPTTDLPPSSTEPIHYQQSFNISNNFLPGNGGPPEGFANSINDDSNLKNLFFVRQTCPQGQYIPSSTSDMYMIKHPESTTPYQNKYTLLDQKPFVPELDKNPHHLGKKAFNNHTRQQVKNL